MIDPPPSLRADETPNDAELAALALELLRERAQDDPDLAAQMRQRGLLDE
jgi:hypothetical protein